MGLGSVPDSVVLPQELLDELASAWSRLDRSRPELETGVRAAMQIVAEWMARALDVEQRLRSVHPPFEEERGQPLLALRWAWGLVQADRSLDALLTAAAGPEHEFWELYWRALEELRLEGPLGQGWEEYRLHLAGLPVRQPASRITEYLLSTATACATRD